LDDEFTLISLRMGIALIAVVPTMLASVMQSRNELIARLHHMAMHDALTGASNRNAFREDIGRLLADSGKRSAVMMIDLDHFKAVNDTHGHAVGDAVLTAFAARTRVCLRGDDLIGRLGGEEFAVALADCPASDALALANRIRKLAKKPVILDDGTELTVTASIGLVIPENGPDADLDDILSKADTLVYRAKQNGRDRVEMADTATAAGTTPRLVSIS
jgi:diguanylate cyclase (GGDEF)-like protein